MMSRISHFARGNTIKNLGAVRAYHPPAEFKPPTMDELPVPQGSWQADYNAKQKKYNMHLITGVVFSIFTFAFAKQGGYLFMNWGPPELPKEE